MFTQVEQDTVEQLEALVDQPEKRDVFTSLVGKMNASPITDFFRACHQYYIAIDDYYRLLDAKNPDAPLYFEKAKMNMGVAQKIAADFLRNNPDSVTAKYMEIFLNSRIPFDHNHNVVLRGGLDSWFHDAVERSKDLAAIGFGPATHFLAKAPTTSGEEISRMLMVAMKKGSVLCKAQLSQRIFADLLNNLDNSKKIPFPPGLKEADLINNLKFAINAGDYQSMAFLPKFIEDVCSALRALSQVNHEGIKKVTPDQVIRLRHLADIAKELSTVMGSRDLSLKIDTLIRKSEEAANSYHSAKEGIRRDQAKMTEFESKVKNNEIDVLSEKLFMRKLVVNLANVFKIRYDKNDPEILKLFLSHPKIRQNENLPDNANLAFLDNRKIKSLLTEKEVLDFLVQKAQEKLKEHSHDNMAEGGKREFRETASQIVSEQSLDFSSSVATFVDQEATRRSKIEYATLKVFTDTMFIYIRNTFAASITKALGDVRVAATPAVSWVRADLASKTIPGNKDVVNSNNSANMPIIGTKK